jgi:hypothetical protein
VNALTLEHEVTDEMRWSLLQKRAQEVKVLRAFTLFRNAGIEPVLIKGLAAAASYPPNVSRIAVDIDLAVSAADFDAGFRIAHENQSEGLAIDLHRELRHLDTVPWPDLFANSQLIRVSDDTVRVLCPEDHLRVLCVHWLTDGGSSKERLWDIYYSIANKPENFDWSRFLDVVDERRRRWLLCTLGIAEKYLDLDLSGTPAEKASEKLPKWLTKTVEQEWSAKTSQKPLETTLRSPKMFFQQIGKRLRPNPIWATVQMNGSFDARTRLHYQIGNIFSRIVPSFVRIRDTLKAGG